ncbi:MAG: hypothetical protein MK097_18235 [Dechloromonas sp.]|nr:hypothetical protein [Dechloromonas sp.]
MNDNDKKTPTPPARAAKVPQKLIPRTAPKSAPQSAAGEDKANPSVAQAPRATAKPAAPAATKPRAPRKPSAVEETVAKHQKVLADALAKAQAIKYDQPKVMQQEAAKKGKEPKAGKAAPKAKKIKLVRDSYAMPEAEYARIGELKKRLAALGNEVKKSELLRGGIALLAALNDSELKAVMGRVERIKTGRPKK